MKVIKTYAELDDLQQHLRKFDVYHKGEKYKLQLSQLDSDENNRVTDILNTYSRRCGRDTKNFVMGIAFVSYVIYHFLAGGTFSSIAFSELFLLTACTILGAITGKLLGLIYVRWRMIKFVGKLLASKH